MHFTQTYGICGRIQIRSYSFDVVMYSDKFFNSIEIDENSVLFLKH